MYLCCFEIEPAAHPKTMRLAITDVVPGFNSRSNIVKAIYKFEGDTLTICLGPLGPETRPNEFSEKEGDLLVFERVKPEK